MTKQEAIIVSAYTGILMCNFADLHEYCEKVMGRPIWTHEFADRQLMEAIKKRVKPEFLRICAEVAKQ